MSGEEALQPYVVACGAAINACARAGQSITARQILEERGDVGFGILAMSCARAAIE